MSFKEPNLVTMPSQNSMEESKSGTSIQEESNTNPLETTISDNAEMKSIGLTDLP